MMKQGILSVFSAWMLAVFLISAMGYLSEQNVRFQEAAVYETLRDRKLREHGERKTEQLQRRPPLYVQLQKRNPDFAGWIRIEGTVLDYPVCASAPDPEFYLNHDIYREENRCGTPFLDRLCGKNTMQGNLLVYGHHMRDGSMFAVLEEYKDPEFQKNHSYIRFEPAGAETECYEVAAVLCLKDGGTGFPWQELLFPETQKSFTKAVEQLKNERLYDTGIVPVYGRKMLALVTCEYTQKEGRLMIIGCKC